MKKIGADMARLMSIHDNPMVDKHLFAKAEHGAKERRSGIERRIFSYSWHIPERRSGSDKRKQEERI